MTYIPLIGILIVIVLIAFLGFMKLNSTKASFTIDDVDAYLQEAYPNCSFVISEDSFRLEKNEYANTTFKYLTWDVYFEDDPSVLFQVTYDDRGPNVRTPGFEDNYPEQLTEHLLASFTQDYPEVSQYTDDIVSNTFGVKYESEADLASSIDILMEFQTLVSQQPYPAIPHYYFYTIEDPDNGYHTSWLDEKSQTKIFLHTRMLDSLDDTPQDIYYKHYIVNKTSDLSFKDDEYELAVSDSVADSHTINYRDASGHDGEVYIDNLNNNGHSETSDTYFIFYGSKDKGYTLDIIKASDPERVFAQYVYKSGTQKWNKATLDTPFYCHCREGGDIQTSYPKARYFKGEAFSDLNHQDVTNRYYLIMGSLQKLKDISIYRCSIDSRHEQEFGGSYVTPRELLFTCSELEPDAPLVFYDWRIKSSALCISAIDSSGEKRYYLAPNGLSETISAVESTAFAYTLA